MQAHLAALAREGLWQHLMGKPQGAQRLANRCLLWVDINEHECLAIATKAWLHVHIPPFLYCPKSDRAEHRQKAKCGRQTKSLLYLQEMRQLGIPIWHMCGFRCQRTKNVSQAAYCTGGSQSAAARQGD